MTELSRQQRRLIQRQRKKEQAARWEAQPCNNLMPRDGAYLPKAAFRPFFARVNDADFLCKTADDALKTILEGAEIPETGLRLKVRLVHSWDSKAGKQTMTCALTGMDDTAPHQSSHVALMGFMDDGFVNPDTLRAAFDGEQTAVDTILNTHTEIRFPLQLLRAAGLPKSPMGSAYLYQIRFNTEEARHRGMIDSSFFDVVGRGYVGVTGRPFVKRMMEHYDDMRSGGGHLLHSVWRELRDKGIPHRVIGQIVSCSEDEDWIYEMEEHFVEQQTLVPLGLNMIPGGRNGIAKLRAMGFVGVTMEERDRTLAAAIQNRIAGMPFYRKDHPREYKPGKFTWVSGCWVRPGGKEF